jgi:ABC-2 type transport system permease protein/sodium transport system permease protein
MTLPTPGSPASTSGFGRLTRLARKEVSEILRDRRTVITLVLMPLLLYPLLSIAFRQFFLAVRAEEEDPAGQKYSLAFNTDEEMQQFARLLHYTSELVRKQDEEAGRPPRELLQFAGMQTPNLDAMILAGHAHLGVRVKDVKQFRPSGDLRWDCELLYKENSAKSLEALHAVESRIALVNARGLRSRLNAPGAAPPVILVRTDRQAVKAEEEQPFSFLGALIPLILILMTITGAVYPAIDLTAGERERGTLEILCAAPVSRVGLLFSKYVAVVVVAVLTALVNLVAMTVTLSVSGLWAKVFQNATLTPLLVVQIFLLLLLFAAFFSAVLLCITSFARSFKEAQAYLIPLMLVSLAPGVMGLMPGVQLSGMLTVTPLINIVLLARDLFEGRADTYLAVMVVVSTLLYAAGAIALAARIFGAEAVLYSEQGNWSDVLRRPARWRPAPSVGGALFCLAAIFLVGFVAGNYIALDGDLSTVDRFQLVAGLSVALFVGLPLAGTAYGRVRPGSALRLRVGPWVGYLGAALLGLSAWVLVTELAVLLYHTGISHFDAYRAQLLRGHFAALRQALPVPAVAALAAIPGVVEELFFRGYLFSALRARTSAAGTIVITSLLFGLFHLVGLEGFSPERGLVSTLMGFLLGWVAWRTGSVLPGMLLHGCHNGLLILLTYGQPSAAAEPGIPEHHPWYLLAGAAVVVPVGLFLIQKFCKPTEPTQAVEG